MKHYNPSEPCTGTAEPSRDTLTLEKLVTTIRKLGLDRPRPLALWFIDREPEYIWLIKQFDPATDDWQVSVAAFPYLYGILLRQFTTSIATKDELEGFPSFCKHPGIWIEMSDGNHVLLGETK